MGARVRKRRSVGRARTFLSTSKKMRGVRVAAGSVCRLGGSTVRKWLWTHRWSPSNKVFELSPSSLDTVTCVLGAAVRYAMSHSASVKSSRPALVWREAWPSVDMTVEAKEMA